MAKRAAKKYFDTKQAGSPQKQCPKCQKFVHARTAICPNPECGHRFLAKSAKTVRKPGKTGSGRKPEPWDQGAAITASELLSFVRRAGGIESVRGMLDDLEAVK